jgi:putative hydrolase of the HAD superfamily
MNFMVKAILFDAGGVIYLNRDGIGYLNQPLIEFIRSNQDKYRFGIISTTNYDLKTILKKDGIDSLFSLVLTSGETGMDKVNVAIYEKAINLLGMKPKEIIFVDNSEEYVNAAKSAGITSILYRDPETYQKELKEDL